MPEKTISNPKAEVCPSANAYNDHDRLNDLLISLKHVTYMYSLLVQEASNQTLKKEIEELMKKSSTMERTCFDLMFEKGWYKLEEQPANKVETTKKTFTQREAELN